MKQMKKVISVLIAICMLVSTIPANVFAAGQKQEGYFIFDGGERQLPSIITSGEEFSMFALDADGNPILKESNEVRWIDRLADLPEYSMEFYDWLAENSDGDGTEDALINPTTGVDLEKDNQTYVHPVTTVTGLETEYYVDQDANSEDIKEAVEQALLEDVYSEIEKVDPYIFNAFYAFDRDYPEVFWLSGESESHYGINYTYDTVPDEEGKGTITYEVIFYFVLLIRENFDIRTPKYRSYTTIYNAIEDRDNWVTNICAGASGSYEEKTRYFNEWLTNNNCYNTSISQDDIDSDSWECLSALEGNEGSEGPVCEGYARAFKVLCDEATIPCVLVDGEALGEPHMWNYVQMDDGKWYAADVTWNDPSVPEVTGKVSGHENEDYFLVGSTTNIESDNMTFEESHVVKNVIVDGGTAFTNGPVLEKEAYIPHEHGSMQKVEGYESTCVEEGQKTYYVCECGQWFEDEEGTVLIEDHDSVILPLAEHDYKTATAEPTCTEEGYTLHTCSVCNDSFIDNYVDPTGHTFSEWSETKAPTCMEKGEETRSCACGEVQTRELEVLDHLYNSEPEFIWADDSRTCKAIFECAYECGVDFETDCTMTAESTDATCTVAGTVKYTATCTMGDVTYSENHSVTNATLDHEYEPVYDWSDDKTMCVATFKCARCEKFDEIKCNVTVEEVEKGIEYTASCTFDGKEYKDTILEIILPFTDVKDTSWYYEAVKYVYENDIMNGLTETTFGPNETLDRAMFATILYRLSGSPEVEFKEIFTDVKDGRYYSDAVIWAYENEIVTGYGNDTFGPADKITREQMVVMMYRYAKLMEYDLGEMAEYDHFPDADKVSNFAKEAMKWAIGNEIINGKANGDEVLLDPQGNALRAECAAIIMRFAK